MAHTLHSTRLVGNLPTEPSLCSNEQDGLAKLKQELNLYHEKGYTIEPCDLEKPRTEIKYKIFAPGRAEYHIVWLARE